MHCSYYINRVYYFATPVRLYRIKVRQGDVGSFVAVFLGSCTVSRACSLAVESPAGRGSRDGSRIPLRRFTRLDVPAVGQLR